MKVGQTVIHLINGPRASGKTLYGRYLADQAIKNRLSVWTNIPGTPGNAKNPDQAHVVIWNGYKQISPDTLLEYGKSLDTELYLISQSLPTLPEPAEVYVSTISSPSFIAGDVVVSIRHRVGIRSTLSFSGIRYYTE